MITDTLIKILEFTALVCVGLSLYIIGLMIRYVKKRTTPVKKEPEPKKEKTRMSKEASEGITFNDIFMFMIAVPLVLLWVGFAGFVIHTGLNNSAVLENIEAYTTLIAILGGPALLIIKDALDVWKQEQAERQRFISKGTSRY